MPVEPHPYPAAVDVRPAHPSASAVTPTRTAPAHTQPPPPVALAEHRRPQQRADEDARLARGRDRADRGASEREQDQHVGERAQHADARRPAEVLPRPLAPPQDPGREHERDGQVRAPVVDDRRQLGRPDRVLVPQRVGRDRHAGEDREQHRLARAVLPPHEREHRRDDDQRAGQRERARPLAEEGDRGRAGEQRAGAAGQRVDDREVAGRVAALQEREVERVQQAAPDHQPERHPAQVARVRRQRDHQHRDPDQGAERGAQPHEARAALRALGEEVPPRVGERGSEHESEDAG